MGSSSAGKVQQWWQGSISGAGLALDHAALESVMGFNSVRCACFHADYHTLRACVCNGDSKQAQGLGMDMCIGMHALFFKVDMLGACLKLLVGAVSCMAACPGYEAACFGGDMPHSLVRCTACMVLSETYVVSAFVGMVLG